MRVTPLPGFVFVRRVRPPAATAAGIILVDTKDEDPRAPGTMEPTGLVVGVGPDRPQDTPVSAGQYVRVPKYACPEYTQIDGHEVCVFRREDLVAHLCVPDHLRTADSPPAHPPIPTQSWVLIERDVDQDFARQQTSTTSIVTRLSAALQHSGTVTAVGPGLWDPETQTRTPLCVAVGDRVLFDKLTGEAWMRGQDPSQGHWLLVQEQDIIAILDGEPRQVQVVASQPVDPAAALAAIANPDLYDDGRPAPPETFEVSLGDIIRGEVPYAS